MIEFTLTETVYNFALETLARGWSRGAGCSPTDKLLRNLMAPNLDARGCTLTLTYPNKEITC